MALRKIDIVLSISDKLGISRKDSHRMVECVFTIIKEQFPKGNTVKISGFGNFLVKSKNARRGRNLHTGAECEISARKVLKFKASKILRDALNKGN